MGKFANVIPIDSSGSVGGLRIGTTTREYIAGSTAIVAGMCLRFDTSNTATKKGTTISGFDNAASSSNGAQALKVVLPTKSTTAGDHAFIGIALETPSAISASFLVATKGPVEQVMINTGNVTEGDALVCASGSGLAMTFSGTFHNTATPWGIAISTETTDYGRIGAIILEDRSY